MKRCDYERTSQKVFQNSESRCDEYKSSFKKYIKGNIIVALCLVFSCSSQNKLRTTYFFMRFFVVVKSGTPVVIRFCELCQCISESVVLEYCFDLDWAGVVAPYHFLSWMHNGRRIVNRLWNIGKCCTPLFHQTASSKSQFVLHTV